MPGLFPGTMVTPAVRLVRPLRSGGMGSVWVAEHLTLHTEVAVKFLSADLAKDPASVTRFSREAAAASQVKSPHVVQMFDHGVNDDGVPFIVMELLEGEDLTRRVRAAGPLDPRTMALIVTQIAKALTRAHERGIIHRDIKPDNIFLCTTEGEEVYAKLLDFGIAKGGIVSTAPSGRTATGALIGTPHYMSPEQAVGSKDIDHRTDLWSLGMVVFEALTGRRAFDADTVGALVLAIHTAELPRPSEQNPALPSSLDAWFATACARKPQDRFENAKVMAEALWGALGDAARREKGVSATAPTLTDRRVSPNAGTMASQAPRIAELAPKVPDAPKGAVSGKVPSLRPPPSPRTSPRQPVEVGAADWDGQIDRTNQLGLLVPANAPEPRRVFGRRRLSSIPPPPGSKLPLVLLLIGVGVLLSAAVVVFLGGEGTIAVLFPSFAKSSASAPAPPPPAPPR